MAGARTVAAVLALILSGIPLASPEHVHEIEDHGHVAVVVHRHLQHHAALASHHDEHGWDHPDAPVATIDQDYRLPSAIVVAEPVAIEVAIIAPPAPPTLLGHVELVDRLIHGPPRAPTLQRGPPSSRQL